jgi:calcium-dependent protein kinase
MAPQVLQGVYSSQADLWSIGVITYTLLATSKPFFSRDKRRMIDLIMRGKVTFGSQIWNAISEDAKDFVQKLLVVDPKMRIEGADAVKHPWIVNREQLPDELPSDDVLASIDGSLLNYRHTSQLKKLALTVIAHRSTTKEILQLRKAFDRFDTVKDGVLSYEEFKAALETMNYTGDEMDDIFSSVVSAL